MNCTACIFMVHYAMIVDYVYFSITQTGNLYLVAGMHIDHLVSQQYFKLHVLIEALTIFRMCYLKSY